jgi:nucleoside-diphosphate-sugar epimerase
MSADLLNDAYAVLDLAAISNDPAGDLNPTITLDVNYRARRRLQELCIEKQVERYVLASSCSVYGFQDEIVDESSKVNPLTTYAEANIRAEEAAFSLKSSSTSFTALRQATVFGLSPRMRFDLVVNAMTLNVWKDGKLRILRDGEQWRPMVHVQDTSRAFLDVLEQPRAVVADQVFNVGSNSQNYKVIDLATQVASALKIELELDWYGDPDHRSYQVSFDKISSKLGFETEWDISRAATEIAGALSSGTIKDELRTRTLNWYMALAEWDEVIQGSRPSATGIL